MSVYNILPPQGLGLYVNTDLEPQMLQVRSHNSATIYLDSQDSIFELDKTNMLLSSIKSANDRANTLAQGIKRLKIVSYGINWVTPNVNSTNNTIIFMSSNTGGLPFISIVPEGFYSSASTLMDAIVTALNIHTFISGLTFSKTSVTGYTDKFNLVSAGGNYLIDPSLSSAVKNGSQLYALPVMTALANTRIVGSMGLFYTRYVDICSTKLNRYTKLPNSSTGYNSSIVARVFLDSPSTVHFIRSSGQFETGGINFSENDSIDSIDFILYDQFGRQLYIPGGGGTGNQSGFNWDMQILVEY